VKPDQVRELSAEDLVTKERELREQMFRLRLQKSIGQLDNALKIREIRRDIARVKTILKQKQPKAPKGRGRQRAAAPRS
jgi:large subunit ribosomal protein L29